MHADFEHVATPPEQSWAYREFRQRAFDFTWHLHSELELTLITRGTGTRIVGTSIESYRPGDLVLIGAEVPHAYVSAPGAARHEAIVLQFRRDFLGSELFARPEFLEIGRLLDRASGAVVFEAGTELVERMASLAGQAPTDRTLSLLQLLVTLAGDETGRVLSAESTLGSLSPPARRRANAVCAYLQEVYAGHVSLADVAAVAHMSPPALSRFFRRAIGRTVTEYVTELRVAAACQLLRDSDLPIASIAVRCGYENLSNFNRRFRAIKGTSPRDYRRVSGAVMQTESA